MQEFAGVTLKSPEVAKAETGERAHFRPGCSATASGNFHELDGLFR